MSEAPSKKQKVRSPNYPAINLEEAVGKARVLYERERTTPTSVDIASTHWNYKNAGAGGGLIAAALRAFGLVEYEGSGDKKKVKITEFARRILLDARPNSQERADALRKAALLPNVHADLWEKWGNTLPSDATIRYHLTADRGFNERAVDDVIAEYKSTLEFSGLLENGNVPKGAPALEDNHLMEQTFQPTIPPESGAIAPNPGRQAAIVAGELEAVRGTLPDGRYFRLVISGEADTDRLRKDLNKIKKFLAAQVTMLTDDEEEDDSPDNE